MLAEYQGSMGSNSRVYHSSQSSLPERNQGNTSTVDISSSGPHTNHAISLHLQHTRDTWAPILGYTTAVRSCCGRGTRATPALPTPTAAGPTPNKPSAYAAYACRIPGIHGLQFYHSSQSKLPERNQGNNSTVNISSSGPHTNHAISLRLQINVQMIYILYV